MGQLNVVAEGRLASDWTPRTAGGKVVHSARLVVNERAKKAGQWVDVADHWFTLQDWNRQAAGGKGDIVRVSGRWSTREWVTQSGEARKDAELVLTGPVEVVRSKTGAATTAPASAPDGPPEW